MIALYALAFLGFVATVPGALFFWAVDSTQMMTREGVCRPADRSFSDYVIKGHWTAAPWRPVCTEEPGEPEKQPEQP